MIQELIDCDLLREEEKKATRVRSGKFSPSMFGRCYRAQYWNRKNEPVSNLLTVEVLRRFKVGKIIHDYAQSFLPASQKEVIINDVDLVGFADIVFSDEVVDIKSCRSFEFKQFDKKGFDIATGKETNCLQVMTYALYLNKPKGRLIFIEKDALESREFLLLLKDWEPKIKEELEILRGFWKQDKLPPPLPRAYGGKECSYCSWFIKCKGGKNEPIANSKE